MPNQCSVASVFPRTLGDGVHPRLSQFLVVIGAAIVAAWSGVELADGDFLLPSFLAVIACAATLSRLLRLPFDVILLGFTLFGYLVGNRGFAQFTPVPSLPLLPAEIALAVAGCWRAVQWAFARRLPFERDPLQIFLLIWIFLGAARVVLDVPVFGLLAVRDFATVYYAAFFFLALHMAKDPRARSWLLGCLTAGLLVMPVTLGLSVLAPDLFLGTLTLHGAPLVFFKGDLAFTFLALGALLFFFLARGRFTFVGRLLTVIFLLAVANGNNRSSMAGLIVVCVLLALARRWRFPLWLTSLAAAATFALLALAWLGNNSWAENKVAGAKDRLLSMVDYSGEGRYASDESGFKGDNNRFRLVWWRNVILETWSSNPAIGLGFGYDLAAGFLQEYYPEGGDDFSARSPHNIFLSVFGRMGLLGLVAWCGFTVVLFKRTWRVLRLDDHELTWALWCGTIVIFVSSCFGVVLEGPMGAVPFWILLALAESARREALTPPLEPSLEAVPEASRTKALAV